MNVDISPKRPPISSWTAAAPSGSGSDGGGSSTASRSMRWIMETSSWTDGRSQRYPAAPRRNDRASANGPSVKSSVRRSSSGTLALRREARIDDDLHLVAHLERTHQPAIRLDPPGALCERDRSGDATVTADVELRAQRTGAARQGELALDGEPPRPVRQSHGARAELDRLPGQ